MSSKYNVMEWDGHMLVTTKKNVSYDEVMLLGSFDRPIYKSWDSNVETGFIVENDLRKYYVFRIED